MTRLLRYAYFLIFIFALPACSSAGPPEPRAVSASTNVQVLSPVRILAPRPAASMREMNAIKDAPTLPPFAAAVSIEALRRTVLIPTEKGDGASMGWMVGYAMRTLNEADLQSSRPRRRQRDERL